MNYWYEYVVAFGLGLAGCVLAANLLSWLLPLKG